MLQKAVALDGTSNCRDKYNRLCVILEDATEAVALDGTSNCRDKYNRLCVILEDATDGCGTGWYL